MPQITHGFHATITAQLGKGGELIDLLLSAQSLDNPECLVFLVGRSASNADVIFVTEGWVSQEAHSRFFGGSVAQDFIARLAPLVAGETVYVDEVPVGGKAILG